MYVVHSADQNITKLRMTHFCNSCSPGSMKASVSQSPTFLYLEHKEATPRRQKLLSWRKCFMVKARHVLGSGNDRAPWES